MKRSLLKEILSIPSFSRHESDVRSFLTQWAIDNNISYRCDIHGNLYMKKGELEDGEAYPCIVSHMDTVHSDQQHMVGTGKKLKIIKTENQYGDIYYAQRLNEDNLWISTGCGGDDKASIFIVLELLQKFDKIMAAFFVEEEIGCKGSRPAKNDEWLNQAGYFIQFDAPTDDWISRVCGGVHLFDDDFFDTLLPVWVEHNMSMPNMHDPFTDIMALKQNYPVNCINYFAGYMNMHSKEEYVSWEFVNKAFRLGRDTIKKLGTKQYLYKKKEVFNDVKG